MDLTSISFLLKGTAVTVKLSFLSLFMAFLLGFLFGMMKASKPFLLRGIATIYIEVLRGTPLLVNMLFVFYCVPILLGKEISPFVAAVTSLSLYGGAYAAEIVRGGIESVDRGQWEAAQATGLGHIQMMRHVVLPQAFRVMIPPGVGLFIAMVKDSSLASIIGYVELTRAGDIVRANNFTTWGPLAIVAVNYFVLCYLLSKFGAYTEKRFPFRP
jgi:His/Glu/Gln/Arg/opine family amino acid ABC transporter permease subunit